MFLILITWAYLNKYVETYNYTLDLIFLCIILFSEFAKKLMNNNVEKSVSVSTKLLWFIDTAKRHVKKISVKK